jgi:predicted nucleic acid-binding protein
MRFADTSYWVAFHRRRETHHEQARALWLADAGPVVTSELILGETWTFLRRRESHGVAVQFLDLIEASPRVGVLGVDAETVGRAWQWLRRRDERVYSFVDATSFELMRSSKIREVLAFDDDFTAAGFIELRL